MSDSPYVFRAPWWFTVLLILFSLPALLLSNPASKVLAGGGWLSSDFSSWLYPAYVVIAGVCSWICYATRRVLAWILFGLIVLTDAGLILTLFI